MEKSSIDVGGYAARSAGPISGGIVNVATDVAKGLAELLFILAEALFILFFIYTATGRKFCDTAITRFCSESDQHAPLSAPGPCHNYRRCSWFPVYLSGQGATAGIGYFFADVPAPILFAGLTAVAALVPVVGTGIVWIPLAVFVAFKGAYLKAGLLALWCMFMVSLSDNAIPPIADWGKRWSGAGCGAWRIFG